MMDTPLCLLLVDDDEVYRRRLARALRERGLEVLEAAHAEEALAKMAPEPPELAVVDLRMPGVSGLDLVTSLRSVEPNLRILVLTGYGSIATAVEAMKRGAAHYLTKPADADEILKVLGVDPGAQSPVGPQTAAPQGAAAVEAETTTPSLARAEWEHMQRVLADCNNNISEAARRLGLPRRTLQRKLQKNPPES